MPGRATTAVFGCRRAAGGGAPPRLLCSAGPMSVHSGIGGPAAGLTGRLSEREVLDRFVAGVRAGEGLALVVRGEPGVGKTALLDYLAGRASGCRVARAAGVQSEMELAFAGLHQLCAPMLDHAESLPGPQREALRTAFGLSAGPVPDRFLVSRRRATPARHRARRDRRARSTGRPVAARRPARRPRGACWWRLSLLAEGARHHSENRHRGRRQAGSQHSPARSDHQPTRCVTTGAG